MNDADIFQLIQERDRLRDKVAQYHAAIVLYLDTLDGPLKPSQHKQAIEAMSQAVARKDPE